MQRTCIGCTQTDDHPRHVIALVDGSEVTWHLDCHSTMGCESCVSQLEGAQGVTGDALRTHLTTKDG